MKKYLVMFEIHIDYNRKEFKEVEVEAGNKRLAIARAMGIISKEERYNGKFKDVKSVEEVN